MNALTLSCIALGVIFGAALLGMLLRRVLPDDHVIADSRGLVMLGTGLVGTMAALVLGLMISSAKDSYDAEKNDVTQMCAKAIMLDRVLDHYGPEAHDIRIVLRVAVANFANRMWPKEAQSLPVQQRFANVRADSIYDQIAALQPKDDNQRFLQKQAFDAALELGSMRLLMFEQLQGSQISMPMLEILVSWFAIIFISYGLYAPPNPTLITTLFLCAMSVSGAIFLVLSLYLPFDGVLRISNAPIRQALSMLAQ